MCTLTERRWLIVAFQTGCAAAGGLNCLPDVVADDEGRELVQHGSALFPIACYEEDLKSYSVAWHWHEEFEYILAVKGPLAVDVSKARLVLQACLSIPECSMRWSRLRPGMPCCIPGYSIRA